MDLALALLRFDGVNSATEAFAAARDRPDAPARRTFEVGLVEHHEMATSRLECGCAVRERKCVTSLRGTRAARASTNRSPGSRARLRLSPIALLPWGERRQSLPPGR